MLSPDAHERLSRWLERHQLDPSLLEDLATLSGSLVASAMDETQVPLRPGDSDLLPPTPPPRPSLEPVRQSVEGEPPARDFDALYEDLGVIGRGGMGEVHRVRDRLLHRVMVAKMLREDRLAEGDARARFLEEAQITAQLQHANIVPVHELAQTEDGRPWFTMKEVQGRTLKELIEAVHAASGEGGWEPTPDGWNFRRLVDDLRRACEAVAYAHGCQVLHRDLKPSNIMISDFGEVQVVDWGLAKVGQRRADSEEPPPPTLESASPPNGRPKGPKLVNTRRSDRKDILETTMGTVAGTLSYMPPEQAVGDIDLIDERSDVFSLGAILYEILSGHPPYQKSGWHETWIKVVQVDFPALSEHPQAGRMPPELVAICERAMAREPEARFPSAEHLLAELVEWLEGARKRDEAADVVAEAEALLPRIQEQRELADQLTREARQLAAGIPSHAPIDEKRPLWELEDRAERATQEVGLLELLRVQRLRAAFAHVPDYEPAQAALAEHYRARHEHAERAGRKDEAERLLRQLAEHDRGGHAAYLRGVGRLSLSTQPSGAIVDVYELVEQDRRLVPRYLRTLGQTPIEGAELPIGSYLLKLRREGYEDTNYPVLIEREQHWRSAHPREPSPGVPLLPAGSLGVDEVYVPEGWAWLGLDDPAEATLPLHRPWVPGFVMMRFHVTNRQYLSFLNDLVASGRVEEALALAPRGSAEINAGGGHAIFSLKEDGRFTLVPDEDGQLWDLDWPVFRVARAHADAFARWRAERTGQPWRLPGEVEWEKAARGVDGRLYPWGHRVDGRFYVGRGFFSGLPVPLTVHDPSHATDNSVYGIRGMAGNALEWCGGAKLRKPRVDRSDPELPRLLGVEEPDSSPMRGGGFMQPPRAAKVITRKFMPLDFARDGLSFRLVRGLN